MTTEAKLDLDPFLNRLVDEHRYMSQRHIADVFGTTQSTVSRRMRMLGIAKVPVDAKGTYCYVRVAALEASA